MVEKIIKRLLIEMNIHDRSGIFGYTQRLLAYNSNKIEGSTLDERQTASLFETGSLKSNDNIIAKDIEEMNGHFLMFNNMLFNYKETLSHEIIKKYHYELKNGVFQDKLNGYVAGEYKKRRNIVSTISVSKPEDVEYDLERLLDEYNNKDIITLEDIAIFHARYEKIHPFQDGNGRTGRIIIYKECLKNNIIPLIISDSNKINYYNALYSAQMEENYKDLIELFKFEQQNYQKNIKDFIK